MMDLGGLRVKHWCRECIKALYVVMGVNCGDEFTTVTLFLSVGIDAALVFAGCLFLPLLSPFVW